MDFRQYLEPIDNDNHYQLYLTMNFRQLSELIDNHYQLHLTTKKDEIFLAFRYYCSLRLKRLATIRAPNPIRARFDVSPVSGNFFRLVVVELSFELLSI